MMFSAQLYKLLGYPSTYPGLVMRLVSLYRPGEAIRGGWVMVPLDEDV